jgi:hypothetical protein
VCVLTGQDSISNSSRGIVQFKAIFILADIPNAVLEQVEFFNRLKQAIRSALGISMEWNISISLGDSSVERRLGLTSNGIVSVVFISMSASLGEALALQSKCNSPAFLDQLNSLGFKASMAANPQLTSTSNPASSSLVVAVSSAAAGLTCLTFLFCLARRYFGKERGKSKIDVKSGAFLEDGIVKCSFDIPRDVLEKDSAGNASAIMTGIDPISESDYSTEFEDVLQLIARLSINIKSLVDPLLRKDIEATIENSNELNPHDSAAVLQLISTIELDEKSFLNASDRKKLQQRVTEGPFTENHFLVLKLLCESEDRKTSMALNEVPIAPGVSSQQTIQGSSHIESDIFEDKISESYDKPLHDVLLLLKKCDLEPSYLMQNESRKLIEGNLTKRKGPLLAEHLAVLQLISKAEISSNLSMDSMRKGLLEKRIKEGPLDADQLSSVLSFNQVDSGDLKDLTLMGPIGHARAEVGASQLYAAGLDHQAKQYETCEVSSSVGTLLDSAGHGDLGQESKAPFFTDAISGLEVRSSLLTREEKSALQLMELRAKTARIRQSLPEWVRNGLVPPRRKPFPLAAVAVVVENPSLATVLAENIANCTDYNTGGGAVQISCKVQADLGFMNAFLPTTEQPKLQQKALESLLFGVEQHADNATGEQQPVSGWQAGPLAEEVLTLSPTSPSRMASSLAWFSSALAQCVSNCLRAVLGACCSGLDCLIGLCKLPVSGHRA